MIKAGEQYRAAITGDTRRVLLRALIDIISPDLVYGAGNQSSAAVYSKPEQLHNKNFDSGDTIATLEHNRWLLDGRFTLLPEEVTAEVGAVSEEISGADGSFATPQWVELTFQNVSILQACSVYFSGNAYDGIPVDFTVEVRQGGKSYHTETYTGNTATSVSLSGFTVHNPDGIRVTVSKWSLPGRRLRVIEIVPGVYERWGADMIAAFNIQQQANFSGLALPYGTCTLSMDNLDRRFEPRSKDGIFQSIEERQGIAMEIGVKTDGGDVYIPVGVFYQYSGGWKTGDNGLTMQWNLVDIIGLLSNREYFPPAVLPTTLGGWVASIVGQLGSNFADKYIVDPDYSGKAVTALQLSDVADRSCGEILRYVCMATGTFARADNSTGKLAVEPYWSEGNKYTLDNLAKYPTMAANDDIAVLNFEIYDTADNHSNITVSGTATASSQTVKVNNPFLHTKEAALTAARQILSTYGGNILTLTGRGDPSSEIGDVDTVWLNEKSATTARRQSQSFSFSGGVLTGCQSTLLQADGAAMLYTERTVITEAGTWTAPAGKKKLRIILVQHGEDGTDGTAGSWESSGSPGTDGRGGKVWGGTIDINDGQTFDVSFGEETTFGAYSTATGRVYENGYTDVTSGDSYGRTGVADPQPGSGDGGKGGEAGVQGNQHEETVTIYVQEKEDWIGGINTAPFVPKKEQRTVIDNYPSAGGKGKPGASGCVVVYWERDSQ
nr:MAG TPA: hypothetical protein [Caudoviricetes sp.]